MQGGSAVPTCLKALDDIAQERIKDLNAAILALTDLLHALHDDFHAGRPLQVVVIINLLCYYANCRDQGVRVLTFRVLASICTDAAALQHLTQTRLVLSIVRSLDRDSKCVWERLLALVLVQRLVAFVPGSVPVCILRCLVSIAVEPPQPPPLQDASAAAQSTGQARPGDGAARRPVSQKLNNSTAAQSGAGIPASMPEGRGGSNVAPWAAHAIGELFRRGAIYTLVEACKRPALLPLASSVGVVSCLADLLLLCAGAVGTAVAEPDVAQHILQLFLRLWSQPAARPYAPPALVLDPLLHAFTGVSLHMMDSGEGKASGREAAAAGGAAGPHGLPPNRAAGEHVTVPLATPAQRVRWSACRWLLVSICRHPAGLLTMCTDSLAFPSLISACISHTGASPDFLLSLLRTFVEVLCPPQSADTEGIPGIGQSVSYAGPGHILPALVEHAAWSHGSSQRQLDHEAMRHAAGVAYAARQQATEAPVRNALDRSGLATTALSCVARASLHPLCATCQCKGKAPQTMGDGLGRQQVSFASEVETITPYEILVLSRDCHIPLDVLLQASSVQVSDNTSYTAGVEPQSKQRMGGLGLARVFSENLDFAYNHSHSMSGAHGAKQELKQMSPALYGAAPYRLSPHMHADMAVLEYQGLWWNALARAGRHAAAVGVMRATAYLDRYAAGSGMHLLSTEGLLQAHRAHTLTILTHVGLPLAVASLVAHPHRLVAHAACCLTQYLAGLAISFFPQSSVANIPLPGMQVMLQTAAMAAAGTHFQTIRGVHIGTRSSLPTEPTTLVRHICRTSYGWPPLRYGSSDGVAYPAATVSTPAQAARRRAWQEAATDMARVGSMTSTRSAVRHNSSRSVYASSAVPSAADDESQTTHQPRAGGLDALLEQVLDPTAYLTSSTLLHERLPVTSSAVVSEFAAELGRAAEWGRRSTIAENLSLNRLQPREWGMPGYGASSTFPPFTTPTTSVDAPEPLFPEAQFSSTLLLSEAMEWAPLCTPSTQTRGGLLYQLTRQSLIPAMPALVNRYLAWSLSGKDLLKQACSPVPVWSPRGPGDLFALASLHASLVQLHDPTRYDPDFPSLEQHLGPVLELLGSVEAKRWKSKDSGRRKSKTSLPTTSASLLSSAHASIQCMEEEIKGVWSACALLDNVSGAGALSTPFSDTHAMRRQPLLAFYDLSSKLAVQALGNVVAQKSGPGMPAVAARHSDKAAQDEALAPSAAGAATSSSLDTKADTRAVDVNIPSVLPSGTSTDAPAGTDLRPVKPAGESPFKARKRSTSSAQPSVREASSTFERPATAAVGLEKLPGQPPVPPSLAVAASTAEAVANPSPPAVPEWGAAGNAKSKKDKKERKDSAASSSSKVDRKSSKDKSDQYVPHPAASEKAALVGAVLVQQAETPGEEGSRAAASASASTRKLAVLAAVQPGVADSASVPAPVPMAVATTVLAVAAPAAANPVAQASLPASSELDPLASMVVVKPSGDLEARLRTFLTAAHGGADSGGASSGKGGSRQMPLRSQASSKALRDSAAMRQSPSLSNLQDALQQSPVPSATPAPLAAASTPPPPVPMVEAALSTDIPPAELIPEQVIAHSEEGTASDPEGYGMSTGAVPSGAELLPEVTRAGPLVDAPTSPARPVPRSPAQAANKGRTSSSSSNSSAMTTIMELLRLPHAADDGNTQTSAAQGATVSKATGQEAGSAADTKQHTGSDLGHMTANHVILLESGRTAPSLNAEPNIESAAPSSSLTLADTADKKGPSSAAGSLLSLTARAFTMKRRVTPAPAQLQDIAARARARTTSSGSIVVAKGAVSLAGLLPWSVAKVSPAPPQPMPPAGERKARLSSLVGGSRGEQNPPSLGLITHIRDDDRAVGWQLLLGASGGVHGLCELLVQARAPAHTLQILAQLWEVCQRLPTHQPWVKDELTGVLRVPPSIRALVQAMQVSPDGSGAGHTTGHLGLKNSQPLPSLGHVHANASFRSRLHAVYSQLGSLIATQGLRYLPALSLGLSAPSGKAKGGTAAGSSSNSSAESHSASLLAAVLPSLTATRVISARDWRLWDWPLIAHVLDHWLTQPAVLTEVLLHTPFMQKLGEVIARVGPESLASLAWTPAAMRLVRVAKAWLLLAVHHPLGRSLLCTGQGQSVLQQAERGANANRVKNATISAAVVPQPCGLLLDVALAVCSRLSIMLRQVIRAGPAAAAAARGDKQGKEAANESDQTLQSLMQSGLITQPEIISACLSPSQASVTCARELLSCWLALASSSEGRWLLASLDKLFEALQDENGNKICAHRSVQYLASQCGLPSSPCMPVPLVMDMLLPLASVDSPGTHHLAIHVLHRLDYSQEDSGSRLLLQCWLLGWASHTAPRARSSPRVAASVVQWIRAMLRQANGGAPGWSDWAVHALVQLLRMCCQVRSSAVSDRPLDESVCRYAPVIGTSAVDALTEACSWSRVYLLSTVSALSSAVLESLRLGPEEKGGADTVVSALTDCGLVRELRQHASIPLLELLAGEATGYRLLKMCGLLPVVESSWTPTSLSHVGPFLSGWAQAASRAVSHALSWNPKANTIVLDPGYSDGRAIEDAEQLQEQLGQALLPDVAVRARTDRAASLLLPLYPSITADSQRTAPEGKDGSSHTPAAAPFPLPVYVPFSQPASSEACDDHGSEHFHARAMHAPARARLDLLLQLPWRVSIQAEWESEAPVPTTPVMRSARQSLFSPTLPQGGASLGVSGPGTFPSGLQGPPEMPSSLVLPSAAAGASSTAAQAAVDQIPTAPPGSSWPAAVSGPGLGTTQSPLTQTQGGFLGFSLSGVSGLTGEVGSRKASAAAATPARTARVTVPLAIDAVLHLLPPTRGRAVLPSLSTYMQRQNGPGKSCASCQAIQLDSEPWLPHTDAVLRAVCVDSSGQPCPAPLRAGAQVHASVLLGAQALGPRGSVPFTGSISDDAPGASQGVYARAEDVLSALSARAGLGDPLGSSTWGARGGRKTSGSSAATPRNRSFDQGRGTAGQSTRSGRTSSGGSSEDPVTPSRASAALAARRTSTGGANGAGAGDPTATALTPATTPTSRRRSMGFDIDAVAGDSGAAGEDNDDSSDDGGVPMGSSQGANVGSAGRSAAGALARSLGLGKRAASERTAPTASAPPNSSGAADGNPFSSDAHGGGGQKGGAQGPLQKGANAKAVQLLDQAAAALSNRVSTAVHHVSAPDLSASPPVPGQWVMDVGAVDLGYTSTQGGETGHSSLSHTAASIASVLSSSLEASSALTEDPSSAASSLASVSKLSGHGSAGGQGPGTTTQAPTVVAAHSLAAVSTGLRAHARERCTWQRCAAPLARGLERAGSMQGTPTLGSMQATDLRLDDAPSRRTDFTEDTSIPDSSPHAACACCGGSRLSGPARVSLVPPGSHARFNFLVYTPSKAEAGLSSQTVSLESVDFALSLIPRHTVGGIAEGGAGVDSPILPLHYWAQVARHEEGVQDMEQKGNILALHRICWGSDSGAVSESPDVLQRCAALWAMGMLGRTAWGYAALLRVDPLLPLRVDAAARGLRLYFPRPSEPQQRWAVPDLRDDISMRHCASCALSLWGQGHDAGKLMVGSLGWVVGHGVTCVPCVPPTAYTLLPRPSACVSQDEAGWDAASVAALATYGQALPAAPGMLPRLSPACIRTDDRDTHGLLRGQRPYLAQEHLPEVRPEWQPVLGKLVELASRVTAREARLALNRLRAEHPDLFASSALYAHAHAILASLPVPLAMRRTVHALFERVSFSDKAFDTIGPSPGAL